MRIKLTLSLALLVSYFSYSKSLNFKNKTTEVSFGYTGQEVEQKLDLQNYRTRFYNSKLGKFLSPDIAKEQHGAYSYVGGNPTTFSDPTGLMLYVYDGKRQLPYLDSQGKIKTSEKDFYHRVGKGGILDATQWENKSTTNFSKTIFRGLKVIDEIWPGFIDDLIDAREVIRIHPTQEGNQFNSEPINVESGLSCYFVHINTVLGYVDDVTHEAQPPLAGLVHELIHAYHFVTDSISFKKRSKTYKYLYDDDEEYYTIMKENQFAVKWNSEYSSIGQQSKINDFELRKQHYGQRQSHHGDNFISNGFFHSVNEITIKEFNYQLTAFVCNGYRRLKPY